MAEVKVALGSRSYSVHVSEGGLSKLGSLCARHFESRRLALVSSPRIHRHHGREALRSLKKSGFQVETMLVHDGERAKTPRMVTLLQTRLAGLQMERRDPLVVLAGGTLGDMAGFAAATYLRGVPLVHVPTTLMAQVDSATGGKTGVNLEFGKNLVGAVWQPAFVLCDPQVLVTLPRRQFRSGVTEIVKYACIAEPALLPKLERWLESGGPADEPLLSRWITESVKIKARVVSQDEREHDLRRVLNFGHTLGHALENATGYGRLLHGEAVALGLCAALWMSGSRFHLDPRFVGRVVGVLKQCFPRLTFPEVASDRLHRALGSDKKSVRGKVAWVLLERPGRPIFATPTQREIKAGIDWAQQCWS